MAEPLTSRRLLEKNLAIRLRTAGVVHATLFGRVSRSTKRPASGVHVGVSFGKPMSNRRHSGTVKLAAEITGRGVDLVDLETAGAFELARALGGTEILCASVADRLRMATRMWRTEDDRISIANAIRSVRGSRLPERRPPITEHRKVRL